MLRTCSQGHSFHKTSDCPVCPICEAERRPESGFMSRLPAPARRALEGAGIHTIEQLASQTETELLRLHGFGKASLPVLKEALREAGLSFRTELKS